MPAFFLGFDKSNKMSYNTVMNIYKVDMLDTTDLDKSMRLAVLNFGIHYAKTKFNIPADVLIDNNYKEDKPALDGIDSWALANYNISFGLTRVFGSPYTLPPVSQEDLNGIENLLNQTNDEDLVNIYKLMLDDFKDRPREQKDIEQLFSEIGYPGQPSASDEEIKQQFIQLTNNLF